MSAIRTGTTHSDDDDDVAVIIVIIIITVAAVITVIANLKTSVFLNTNLATHPLHRLFTCTY
jgi:hypothetical protein